MLSGLPRGGGACPRCGRCNLARGKRQLVRRIKLLERCGAAEEKSLPSSVVKAVF